MRSKITLKGMHFKAFHGYYAEEQKIGGEYKIDCEFEYDIQSAIEKDALEDTVDYEAIYAVCKEEMAKPKKLIETVGYDLGQTLLKSFPIIQSLQLTIHKLNPPIMGHMDSASFTICL
ncbi:dihydroneopterin aldolase [Membranihabitans marinus]|uniref:dihydroneopterin aldolase n=1 Tax=Membranihabitans marinus TaxID=1227546 RepID=UPI001F0066FD|nr:dihydroneopterin aldolase [Membranihabitans marinus]